jgi:hypothetical protein
MSPSLIISILAAIISAIAVLVSIWAHVRSHGHQGRIVVLEEARELDRLAKKRKANLTAQIMRDERGRLVLRIENKGLCEARDIRVWLDGEQVSDHPAFVKGQNQNEIYVVGPQSYFQYILGIPSSTHRPSGVSIAWTDDSGEVGSYRNALTF